MKHMTPDKNTQLKELSDAGVVVYAKTIEDEAISQIKAMVDSPLGTNAHIRIMPDCHAGKGCTIGTTMRITDKVCPNLVGVDIGCGVTLIKTDLDFKNRLQELDDVIRKHIPYGPSVQSKEMDFPFQRLRCWNLLPTSVWYRAKCSLGTLGGGNHFIEAYDGGYIAVHSGSRNIGLAVARYYQDLAESRIDEHNNLYIKMQISMLPPHKREAWIKDNRINVPKELSYLTGRDMEDYLHDIGILESFASLNRYEILTQILTAMKGVYFECIESVHNYIDTDSLILRKGAIAAYAGQKLVIPLNMHDGILICVGKGNPEWNCSAPHGAGRLYSRKKAKELFTVEQYAAEMTNIFTTCVNEHTLDEAPFAYKDFREIIECIKPSVEIEQHLTPIYNFKAN